jgi:phospholipase D1/2
MFGSGGPGDGGVSDGDALTPKRPFFPSDRATTYGAQKWRQVKNTLKLLRQKKEERFDYYKSAELMAELRAGAPAVLMLASMIQRDEHGNKRIPVLLEQVRLKVSDSVPASDGDSERHWLFTIDLEYGSGPSRMRWTVKRTIRDIINLHWKYKLVFRNEKYGLHALQPVGARPKQPRFPTSVFPYVRGLRGVSISDEEDGAAEDADGTAGERTAEDGANGDMTAGEGTATDIDGRMPAGARKRSRLGALGISRRSSAAVATGLENQTAESLAQAEIQAALEDAAQRRRYVERQRKMLEKYLQEMVRWLMFRADSNRLCRFLELSALGVRLAAEGSYHGKECFLHIQSSKGLDFRRVLTPGKVIERHSRKWFLVRQSYIVCIESPENMNIYDVYLVDSNFKLVSKKNTLKQLGTKNPEPEQLDITEGQPAHKHHTLKLITSERKVKLWARDQHLIRQFEESITDMLKMTPWHQRNRFDSFAPIRTGVFAQWLVDGRDYMWNVSRAINMAREVIYIHDWWLSPELYMRRPACISQKWRLDRLLQKKAKEGVKIFVIVYRNVEAAMPIDSEYTKFSLLNLHPNIFVQRSPHQFKKNQFFFAHHEKICVVDHDMAFVGGIDLCFGRWDSPQHRLADDKPTGFELDEQPKDADHCQLWPGKDYSNPRVQDFFSLREPYKEMYDRTKVPRMPWHDVAMQIVGQPARDLTRHFIQRWNYVRRGRKPTRPTPFLLPPPDIKQEDIDSLGLSGTCEVQILRSASAWSLGTEHTESSIHTAYIRMIEESEHFVYMENQFFITSTETLNVKMVNRIGDALVERIIRADEKEEDWRCIIVIPMMPGFQSSVADQDGTSVRLICQCQYRSICRGEHSIFGRLRAVGIEPEEYIQFFSLRQWGKINNETVLTTEQLYIHAKTIIVDDRVALIGSANINERSMLGDRDSECAAIVRDRDMIWSTMAGRPYQVGRFAHTLRLRLMREHLGLDTDEIMDEEREADLEQEAAFEAEMNAMYAEENGQEVVAESSKRAEARRTPSSPTTAQSPRRMTRSASFNHDFDLEEAYDERATTKGKAKNVMLNEATEKQNAKDVEGYGDDHWKVAQNKGLDEMLDSVVIGGHEVLVHDPPGEADTPKSPAKVSHHARPSAENVSGHDEGTTDAVIPPVPQFGRRTTDQLGLPRANQLPALPPTDDTDIGGPPLYRSVSGKVFEGVNPLAADIKLANITKDCMRDPLNPSFYDEIWARVAENNTKLYRRVFRCMPDSDVTNWHEFQAFTTYAKRFQDSMEGTGTGKADQPATKPEGQSSKVAAGGAGVGIPAPGALIEAVKEKLPTISNGAHDEKVDPEKAGHEKEKSTLPNILPQSSKTDMEKSALAEEDLKQHITSPPIVTSPPPMESEIPFPSLETAETGGNLKPETSKNGKERRTTTFSALEKPSSHGNNNSSLHPHNTAASGATAAGSVRRRRRATTKGSRRGFQGTEELMGRDDAEELCGMIQGHLVQFPYDWLLVEEQNGNWLYQVDQVAPLQI